VLATSIAETSLTIRRGANRGGRRSRTAAQFDPSSGCRGLVTDRVTRARGDASARAVRGVYPKGRAFQKLCWTAAQEGRLPLPPRRDRGGRSNVLCVGNWRSWGDQASDLKFVTPPHEGRLPRRKVCCICSGTLDATGRITAMPAFLAKIAVAPATGPYGCQRAGRSAPTLACDPVRNVTFAAAALVDLGLRLDASRGQNMFPRRGQPRPPLPASTRQAKRLATPADRHQGPTPWGARSARLSQTESRCGGKGTRRVS